MAQGADPASLICAIYSEAATTAAFMARIFRTENKQKLLVDTTASTCGL
jgi:hypothetical protein